MVKESLEDAVLAKESSQPQSSYEDAATLTEFELKKILIDKMDKMYSLKRSQKDKDEDPFAGSDRGLTKRKTGKDATPATDSDMLQDQEENLGKDDEEPKEKENPEGGDYPFDLTTPLPLVMSRNHQKVPVDYFFNNDLKYLQGGISTITYTSSLIKKKAAQYDLPGIEDMVINIWVPVKKKINVTKPEITKSGIRKRDPYTPYQDLQGFIYVDNNGRNRLMQSDELYTFGDKISTRLRTSLDDITKNIRMEYLRKRRWSTLEKKRANIMIKVIDKQLKERRLMRNLKKFIGGRHYGTDLRLLQRTI
ncbi:hypothetical protein Tco_0680864 [Tanacetum coccineum]|uniref:Uncharacterized protein n=1 Tax=Tanacetum coccineum TaxID=301880 RepID=A0ABQ4XLZ1_9ASTR